MISSNFNPDNVMAKKSFSGKEHKEFDECFKKKKKKAEKLLCQ